MVEQADQGAQAAGFAPLGPVREPLVGATGGTDSRDLDVLYPGGGQLPAVGGPQIEVPAPWGLWLEEAVDVPEHFWERAVLGTVGVRESGVEPEPIRRWS